MRSPPGPASTTTYALATGRPESSITLPRITYLYSSLGTVCAVTKGKNMASTRQLRASGCTLKLPLQWCFSSNIVTVLMSLLRLLKDFLATFLEYFLRVIATQRAVTTI